MDAAITIVMLVPVLLAVALIINVIRKNVTERQAGDPVDISGAIPAVIVLMVAVLVIVAMGNAASPYVYDEESGELTIQKNVPQLDVQPWDSYASDVRSLVIEDGVTIGAGAFDSLTSLEYVSVGEGVTVGSGAFSIDFTDPYGHDVADPIGQFVGLGDGTLYQAIDPSMLSTATVDGKYTVSGFASGVTGVKNLVIPAEDAVGRSYQAIGYTAFQNDTALEFLGFVPDSTVTQFGGSAFSGCTALTSVSMPSNLSIIFANVFNGCTSLETAEIPDGTTRIDYRAFTNTAITSMILPDSVTTLGSTVFDGCTSLVTLRLPSGIETLEQSIASGCTSLTSVTLPASLTTINANVFKNCTSLEEIEFPARLTSIGYAAFDGCTALTSVRLPDSVTMLDSRAFAGCTGVTEVHIGTGFASDYSLSGATGAWTFYASDGTTQLTKTGENLAGKTFQGTAAALIEVSPDSLSLTPEQIQIVHLHDQELQLMLDSPTIDPLPFQPSLQTEQEQVAA